MGGSTGGLGTGGAAGSGVAGHAGSASVADAGGAASEPATGGGPQGGAASGAGENSGQGGEAGEAVTGGAAGAPSAGTISIDVEVTSGDRSVHITNCGTGPATEAIFLAPYPNGNREGEVACVPDLGSGLQVLELGITGLTSGIGAHDASGLTYDCTSDGCVGVGVVVAFVNTSVISSQPPTVKSGTFTLDELSVRRMSGSMDLTLSNDTLELSVKGTFDASLLDCTTFPDQKCPAHSAFQ
jgi:hypothetical protein